MITLSKTAAKALIELEASDAGLPIRGYHVRPDGTRGVAPGAIYVDFDTAEKLGWSLYLSAPDEVSETQAAVPDDLAKRYESSDKLSKTIKDELKAELISRQNQLQK